jgi:hypothetical protein
MVSSVDVAYMSPMEIPYLSPESGLVFGEKPAPVMGFQ